MNSPYTITVATYETETQAIDAVSTWQDRGYKAYFDPVVIKRSPAYELKLWGYETRSDAERDASQIKRKYRLKNVVVE